MKESSWRRRTISQPKSVNCRSQFSSFQNGSSSRRCAPVGSSIARSISSSTTCRRCVKLDHPIPRQFRHGIARFYGVVDDAQITAETSGGAVNRRELPPIEPDLITAYQARVVALAADFLVALVVALAADFLVALLAAGPRSPQRSVPRPTQPC